MNKYQKSLLAMALAAMSVGTAYAQSGSAGAGSGGGVTASTDTFQSWLNVQAGKSKGRVSRQMYMEEASRRWDAMDKDKSGLTTQQIYGMYGGPASVQGGPTATNAQEKKGVTQ